MAFSGAALALLASCDKDKAADSRSRPDVAATKDAGVNLPTNEPGVAYSTINVKCGDRTFTISTGTNGGKCTVVHDTRGKTESGSCQDGNHSSTVICGTENGCTGNSGSGTCDLKST